jgi:hypothetical protein
VAVWHEVELEVPSSAPGLRLTLTYDRSHGSSGVLDLGLVDPLGWRGWSGGARSVVEIGHSSSTPGYLSRGVPAGRWGVVLGLHRIPPEGLDWNLEVEAVTVPEATPDHVPPRAPSDRRPRRDLPAVDGLTWLAGDCHAHTVHSDGSLTVDRLAREAVDAGLDFLWVTDHNTTSHHPLLDAVGSHQGIRLLPGQEVTTADGHANAFGDIGWVDFRRPAREWVNTVGERGGLLSVNHPVSGDCAWRQPLDAPPQVAEVWHWPWADLADGGPLAWWGAAGWPTPIGGSDFHRPERGGAPGTPTTWVACADDDVLGGMAAGRTAVSAGRDAPVLLHLGDEWLAVDAEGTQLVCPDGRRTPVLSARDTFSDHLGPHVLERHDRSIVSIAA